MADTTVLHGQYGYYFPYEDETGKHGLKILDDVYDKYYKPGHLTDAHLSAMLNGASINFNIPNKTGSGNIEIRAKVIPYTSKSGKACKIIQFESDQVSDEIIIEQNSEKIITSYWNQTRFDYTKPQSIIDSLNLEHTWRTWSEYRFLGTLKLATIKVYKYRSRNGKEFLLYGKVENDKCEMITEEQYKLLLSKFEEKREEEKSKFHEELEKCNKLRSELNTWINMIIDTIWPNGSNISFENCEKLLSGVNVDNLEDRVAACFSTNKSTYIFNYYISKFQTLISSIRPYKSIDENSAQAHKELLLQNLKVGVEYIKSLSIRKNLLVDINASGLDKVTDSINIDTALNLGYFTQVQKILVKYKDNAPNYIVNNMYLNIIDPIDLVDKLLNLLKIYHDFYDMPEKDRKSIAKYIAKNKLSDYYDRISSYDDVLEILIGESRDPKLTKPLLESIAGTSRANCLKDKTFYFEKIGRLKSDILLYKPIELVDSLRTHIKEFNNSSDVAILTNIELNSDESFVFQFYTFAGNNNAEGEFDGRRMLNLTRIYNRYHPDKKIGFIFENTNNNE